MATFDCDEQCECDNLKDEIESALDERKYAFAYDMLQSLYDWYSEHSHFTPAQRQAIRNIIDSVQ